MITVALHLFVVCCGCCLCRAGCFAIVITLAEGLQLWIEVQCLRVVDLGLGLRVCDQGLWLRVERLKLRLMG